MPWASYPRESLLDVADQTYVEWYLVFCESDRLYWWNRFLKRGYTHVYAVRWDGYNWISVSPNIGCLGVEILPCIDPDPKNLFQTTKCSDILHINVWIQLNRSRSLWPTQFTCVEIVKALIGVRAWHVFTPWQLHKYLVRRGYGKRAVKTKIT